MSRKIKFRCWNAFSGVMHDWDEMVEKNKIHLLLNENKSYICEQFTGIKDKNGVEIYEGDMFFDGIENCKIEWCEDLAAFIANDGKEKHTLGEWTQHELIIGNIHQATELLNA